MFFDNDLSSRPGHFDKNSVTGGFTAGYLWQHCNGWCFGPEIQYVFTDITVTDAFEAIPRLLIRSLTSDPPSFLIWATSICVTVSAASARLAVMST
ncbi:MAG: hypothetical protein R8G34_18630 [Paracoccaceae bacterium]|nr:hypothetical protein [Paracoccaceae bacterium]